MTEKEFKEFLEEEVVFNNMSKQIAEKMGIRVDEVRVLKSMGKLKLK